MKNESPHDRFIRLATKRTNAVIEKLRVLGHCANRSLYDYSDEEIEKIFSTLSKQINEAKSKFKSRRSSRFTL